MLFAIEYSYRIAPLPYPTLFITARSKTDSTNHQACITSIFTTLMPNLDIAQEQFNARFIPMEPNPVTHGLKSELTEEIITVCCSLHFNKLEDIKAFLAEIHPGG